MHPVMGIYNYDVFRTMKELLHAARLSKILFVRILLGWGVGLESLLQEPYAELRKHYCSSAVGF